MSLLMIAALNLAVSGALMVAFAAAELPIIHALVAALGALTVVALCHQDQARALENGDSAHALAARDAQYMGLIWAWGGLTVAISYVAFLDWKEWWQFSLAFGVAAILAAVSSIRIQNSVSEGPGASALVQSKWLARLQCVGMTIVMLGLFIDGKMDRIGLTLSGPRDWSNDWAGNNAFFFGGLALAILSVLSLRAQAAVSAKTGGDAGGAASASG